jgi:hypothetical protein
MGVIEIAVTELGVDPPHGKSIQTVCSEFKGASENEVPHRGGIRRGFVGSYVEWIFWFQ